MTEAKEFFVALYGKLEQNERIEIRAIGPKPGRVYARDAAAAVEAAGLYQARSDVYFGVATRDGNGGKKENILRFHTAWADLDAKDGNIRPLMRLKRSPLKPSAVVESGKGLHCYWFLDRPYDRCTQHGIERINKGIAHGLGGDSVFDSARVLRVPGTINHKYGKPLPVTLLGVRPDWRYSMDELMVAFCADESPALADSDAPPEDLDTQPNICSVDHVLPCRRVMDAGVDEGCRNNTCFQLAVDMKGRAMPQRSALSILLNWNRRNRPPLPEQDVKRCVESAYSADYCGLGCEKEPMVRWCSSECPVKGKSTVNSRQSAVGEERRGVSQRAPSPWTGEGWGEGDSPRTSVAATGTDGPVDPRDLFWTAAELVELGKEPPRFAVEGLVPQRGVTIISGEGGIGKSFVAMEMARAMASGERFLGHFECVQGPVLVVDLENGEQDYGRRLRQVSAGGGNELDSLPLYMAKTSLDGKAVDLRVDTSQGQMNLRQRIEASGAKLMVVDSMVTIHSQDENNNVAMRQVMMVLEHLSRSYDMAVVLVHHHRKRGMVNDGGQMMRGASDLRNAAVSHLALKRLDKGRLLVEHDKSRLSPELDKFAIRIVDSEDGEGVRIEYIDEAPAVESKSKAEQARELVLGMLEERGECGRRDIAMAGRPLDASRSTILRVLNDLVGSGQVVRVSHGRYTLA